MVIRTNATALRALGENQRQRSVTSKTLEKLSSGFRINRAADDAAGLGVSESMRAQITELNRCQQNVHEGIDVTNTADGALAEINDMLRRAHELCIEAANGIYDETDLNAISDEINCLFDEIDRITAGTRHNDILLFRYKGSAIDIKYEYIETFEPMAPGDYADWGQMDFVQDAEFDPPTAAKAATVSFQLDNAINVNDAMTMDGKSLKIGSYTYNFDGGGYTFPDAGNYYTKTIPISAGMTVQDAMNRVANDYYSGLQSAKVNADGSVTLTAKLQDLSESITVDGKTVQSVAPNGNGAYKNGTQVISYEKNSIAQIDGSGVTNNKPVYSDTAKFSLTLPAKTLTANDITNLNGNTLTVCGKSIPLKNLFTVGMTQDDMGKKLAEKINGLGGGISATYKDGKLEVKASGLDTTKPENKSIYESVTAGTAATTKNEYGASLNGASLGIDVKVTTPSSLEASEICKITIPSSASVPFSFQTSAYNQYLFYDSSSGKFPPDGYPKVDKSYYLNLIDVKGLSSDQITAVVANTIKSDISGATVTVNGNVLTVESNSINKPMNLRSNIKGIPATAKSYKVVETSPAVPGTSYVLNSMGFGNPYSPKYLTREVTIPLNMGASLDINKLAGSGFGIGSNKFEFVKGAAGLQAGYTDVDISGAASFEDVRKALADKMGANYTLTLDDSDPSNVKIKVAFNIATSGAAPVFTDGYHDTDGIFTNSGDATLTKKFSGGTNTGHSQKVIDFSSINDDNLDTLLGKGFRITCATCTGEYINVFFCWKNEGRVPETFEVEDPVTGKTRTIHNIAVELSKVSSGDKIVEDIVTQVRPTLQHYTDVAVGDPPTQLIAMEKRLGDVKDGSTIYRAHILSGLHTNFNYTVEKKEILDTASSPGGNGLTVEFRKMYIYAGSEPSHQWIPIHLPYLDLSVLDLRPPEVDLADGQDPFDWLDRVDAANNIITTARGRIGADYNRLEHTKSALTNTAEHITEAESRIRDADMARLMTQHMRNTILEQSQQSMLAQANAQPQQVLELLK